MATFGFNQRQVTFGQLLMVVYSAQRVHQLLSTSWFRFNTLVIAVSTGGGGRQPRDWLWVAPEAPTPLGNYASPLMHVEGQLLLPNCCRSGAL